MKEWQMQEAKAHLSELVRRVESEGPQDITLHGRSVAVVVSRAMYERMTGNAQSLVEFMRQSPLHGADDALLERDNSLTRQVLL